MPTILFATWAPIVCFMLHAKDTCVDPHETALEGVLDNVPDDGHSRARVYRTLGFGHDALWQEGFVSTLRQVGYDGALRIEHEDPVMSSSKGIEKSVEFLKPILLRTQLESAPSWL